MKKGIKWILLGILCIVLCALCFIIEYHFDVRHYHLTVGSGFMAAVLIGCGIWQIFDKNPPQVSTLIIEDIFKMTSGGCVVVGYVNGAMMKGEKVSLKDIHGNSIKAKIYDIEIYQQKSRIARNTYAALYLKKVEPQNIRIGEVIYYEH